MSTTGDLEWVPCYETRTNFIKIWEEDDAHPIDGESISDAWTRIFGLEDRVRVAVFDGGDTFYQLWSSNRVTVSSPMGDAIYQYLPARKFD